MWEDTLKWLEKRKNKVIVLLATLVILDFLVWQRIFVSALGSGDLKLNFLAVGQGDSELVILPGGVKMLIDGGPPNGKVLNALDEVLSPTEKYIDLVVMSHPQLDHFGGLIDVLKRYRVGAFLWNGREGETEAFESLEAVIRKGNIRTIALSKGDKIHYRDSDFDILWPDGRFIGSKELNDTALVLELKAKNSKTLFTGDIGSNIESYLLADLSISDVDILKVAHHGSKFSSSANFLEATKPEIAVIGVGQNSYGHPTNQVLNRLNDIGSKIYRTDLDGDVKLVINGEKIRIFKAAVKR